LNRKLGIKHIVSIAVAVILVFATGITTLALNDVRDLQQRQQNIQSNINQQREILSQAQSERNYLLAEITEMDIELTELTEEYYETREQLDAVTALLYTAEDDLISAEIQRQNHYYTLRNRIRFMHENNSLTYIELLLSSSSIADFLNNMEHVNRLIEHDNSILNNLIESEERITHHRDEVARHHAEVTAITYELEAQIDDMNVMLDHRAQRIDQLEQDEAQAQAMAAILEQESQQVRLLIANAEAAAQAAADRAARSGGGSHTVTPSGAVFAWPVDGPRGVNSNFGTRTHPITGRRDFHSGIDLRAAHGAPILAAEAGTVIASEFRRGHGNTVIINHGNGVHTLYAHNSRNLVTVGQQVERGQRIALAGSTGFSTGPHLHFEVIINGQHVNPRRHLGI